MMIAFDEAVQIVSHVARPLGMERVAIGEAAGRRLAEPVRAGIDSPRADVSTMDGYAVRDGDPMPLAVVGEAFPGAGFDRPIGPGECVRIFTGAPIPAGATRVVMQERARREGASVWLEDQHDRFIRRRASDFAAGDIVVPAGRRLDSRTLVAVAGADVADVAVHRAPAVRIIANGDELVRAGEARGTPAAIPESISIGLSAFVSAWGGTVIGAALVGDDEAAMAQAASDALAAADVIVMAGGASVGDRDYSRQAFAGHGIERLIDKVAIKPGKPFWLGRVEERIVVGLPGNPTSALVTARLLLAPLLLGLSGGDPGEALAWRSLSLTAPIDPCGDRETFLRARTSGEGIEALPNQDSGAQRTLAEADWLVRRRAGAPALRAGETVEALLF